MTTNTMTDEKHSSKTKKSNKQLYAILLVTFIPLIAAYVAYYTGWGVPDGTVNQGQLLQPAQDVKPLLLDAGARDDLFNDSHRWRILIPVRDPCKNACEQNLYVTRQVHIRLGEKAERIERIALNTGGVKGEEYLQTIAEEHPLLTSYNLPKTDWQNWLKAAQMEQATTEQDFYFLVDPQGFAMLIYTEENTGNELLKDIKKILRYSPEE